jgi:hypothetical protein
MENCPKEYEAAINEAIAKIRNIPSWNALSKGEKYAKLYKILHSAHPNEVGVLNEVLKRVNVPHCDNCGVELTKSNWHINDRLSGHHTCEGCAHIKWKNQQHKQHIIHQFLIELGVLNVKDEHDAVEACVDRAERITIDSAILAPKRRLMYVKTRYKLSEDDYKKMLEKSKGTCYICGRKTKLAIDHDHTTGLVRGLLCINCNTLLALAKDNPEILLNAVRYLSENYTLVPESLIETLSNSSHGDASHDRLS